MGVVNKVGHVTLGRGFEAELAVTRDRSVQKDDGLRELAVIEDLPGSNDNNKLC